MIIPDTRANIEQTQARTTHPPPPYYRVLRKYLNPNCRFSPAFWLLQFRNLYKEQ